MAPTITRSTVHSSIDHSKSKWCNALRTSIALHNAPMFEDETLNSLLSMYRGKEPGRSSFIYAHVFARSDGPTPTQYIAVRLIGAGDLTIILDDFIDRLDALAQEPLRRVELIDKEYEFSVTYR